MLPALTRSSPASTISRLVLPEPDGPTRPTVSPAARSRSMPRRMLTGPAAEGTVRWRPRSRTSASAVGGDGGMASIAAAYGLLGAWRKAVTATGLLVVLGAAAPAAPMRLLVLGDSLSSGYGLPHDEGFEAQLEAALKAHHQDVSLIDCAVSGDTSAGGLARLDWTLADGADAAIVELGANDGLRGVDPAEMRANLAAILDKLAARHIPVLLAGMYAPPNLGPEYEAEFRAAFDALGKRPGV